PHDDPSAPAGPGAAARRGRLHLVGVPPSRGSRGDARADRTARPPLAPRLGGNPARAPPAPAPGVEAVSTPPAPRASRMRGGPRRERLLKEAIRLFGSRGYEATSLEAVASAAGVRKQTLLYYFPTKDALLEACVLETSRRVAQALTEALEAEASGARKTEA